MKTEEMSFAPVRSFQLRRDASASGILHDLDLEISAHTNDLVIKKNRLHLSGLAYRLTRPGRVNIAHPLVGHIVLKDPCSLRIHKKDFQAKMEAMRLKATGDGYNFDYVSKLIALWGIFHRDLELRIFQHEDSQIEIHLIGEKTLGTSILSPIQAQWLKIGTETIEVTQPSERVSRPWLKQPHCADIRLVR